jgi:hypothetical protein
MHTAVPHGAERRSQVRTKGLRGSHCRDKQTLIDAIGSTQHGTNFPTCAGPATVPGQCRASVGVGAGAGAGPAPGQRRAGASHATRSAILCRVTDRPTAAEQCAQLLGLLRLTPSALYCASPPAVGGQTDSL